MVALLLNAPDKKDIPSEMGCAYIFGQICAEIPSQSISRLRLLKSSVAPATNSSFHPPLTFVWGHTYTRMYDYRRQQMWEQVSGASACAMGGIRGHAGVFANAPALANSMPNVIFTSSDSSFVNTMTVAHFIKAHDLPQAAAAIPPRRAPPPCPCRS